MNKVTQQVSLSDNEILIIQEALKFQIASYFQNEEMTHIERLFSLKLGEIIDRLDTYLK